MLTVRTEEKVLGEAFVEAVAFDAQRLGPIEPQAEDFCAGCAAVRIGVKRPGAMWGALRYAPAWGW